MHKMDTSDDEGANQVQANSSIASNNNINNNNNNQNMLNNNNNSVHSSSNYNTNNLNNICTVSVPNSCDQSLMASFFEHRNKMYASSTNDDLHFKRFGLLGDNEHLFENLIHEDQDLNASVPISHQLSTQPIQVAGTVPAATQGIATSIMTTLNSANAFSLALPNTPAAVAGTTQVTTAANRRRSSFLNGIKGKTFSPIVTNHPQNNLHRNSTWNKSAALTHIEGLNYGNVQEGTASISSGAQSNRNNFLFHARDSNSPKHHQHPQPFTGNSPNRTSGQSKSHYKILDRIIHKNEIPASTIAKHIREFIEILRLRCPSRTLNRCLPATTNSSAAASSSASPNGGATSVGSTIAAPNQLGSAISPLGLYPTSAAAAAHGTASTSTQSPESYLDDCSTSAFYANKSRDERAHWQNSRFAGGNVLASSGGSSSKNEFSSRWSSAKGGCCVSRLPVLLPFSQLCIIWDGVVIGFACAFLFMYSILVFFAQHIAEQTQFAGLFMCAACVFGADILVNFHKAFFQADHLITTVSEIAKRYLRSYFLADAISFAAIMYKLLFTPTQFTYNPQHFIQNYALNIVVLLKILCLPEKRRNLQSTLVLKNYQKHILRLFDQIAVVVFVAHIMGTLWHGVAVMEQELEWQANWQEKIGIKSNPWFEIYAYSLYWALTTMSTVGYGDITPTNALECAFVTGAMIIMSCVFAYSINNIGIILQDIERDSNDLNQQVAIIHKFLRQKGVGLELQTRVKHYLRYLSEESKDRNKVLEDSILAMLSNKLRDEVIREINAGVLSKCRSIFSQNFSAKVNERLMLALEEVLIQPNQVIFAAGDISDYSNPSSNSNNSSNTSNNNNNLNNNQSNNSNSDSNAVHSSNHNNNGINSNLNRHSNAHSNNQCNQNIIQSGNPSNNGVSGGGGVNGGMNNNSNGSGASNMMNHRMNDCAMYFVYSGKVEIYQSTHVLATLQGDSIFGELAFFTGQARSASARSVNLVTLYKLSRSTFLKILEEFPEDFERFKMIAELIMFSNDLSTIHANCYACKSATHLASNCPLVHCVRDRQFVVLRDNFNSFQHRNSTKRRTNIFTKSSGRNMVHSNAEAAKRLKQQAVYLGSGVLKMFHDGTEVQQQNSRIGFRKSRVSIQNPFTIQLIHREKMHSNMSAYSGEYLSSHQSQLQQQHQQQQQQQQQQQPLALGSIQLQVQSQTFQNLQEILNNTTSKNNISINQQIESQLSQLRLEDPAATTTIKAIPPLSQSFVQPSSYLGSIDQSQNSQQHQQRRQSGFKIRISRESIVPEKAKAKERGGGASSSGQSSQGKVQSVNSGMTSKEISSQSSLESSSQTDSSLTSLSESESGECSEIFITDEMLASISKGGIVGADGIARKYGSRQTLNREKSFHQINSLSNLQMLQLEQSIQTQNILKDFDRMHIFKQFFPLNNFDKVIKKVRADAANALALKKHLASQMRRRSLVLKQQQLLLRNKKNCKSPHSKPQSPSMHAKQHIPGNKLISNALELMDSNEDLEAAIRNHKQTQCSYGIAVKYSKSEFPIRKQQ